MRAPRYIPSSGTILARPAICLETQTLSAGSLAGPADHRVRPKLRHFSGSQSPKSQDMPLGGVQGSAFRERRATGARGQGRSVSVQNCPVEPMKLGAPSAAVRQHWPSSTGVAVKGGGEPPPGRAAGELRPTSVLPPRLAEAGSAPGVGAERTLPLPQLLDRPAHHGPGLDLGHTMRPLGHSTPTLTLRYIDARATCDRRLPPGSGLGSGPG